MWQGAPKTQNMSTLVPDVTACFQIEKKNVISIKFT